MRLSRRVVKIPRNLPFKKMKEELNKSISEFQEDVEEIIYRIIKIKIDFESSIAEIFNPYGSSVGKIYEIKEKIEDFESSLLIERYFTFRFLERFSESILRIMEREKFLDEDYKACLQEFFQYFLRSAFFSKILDEVSDLLVFGKEIIKDIAEIIENIGKREGVLKDKFKRISEKIDRFTRESRNVIKRIAEAESESMEMFIKIIEEEYSSDNPRKMLERLVEEARNLIKGKNIS